MRWIGQAAALLLRRRLGVLVALALVTAAFAGGMPRLQFDFSPQAFFDTGDDESRFLEAHEATFGRSDNLVMVVVRRPAGVLDPPVLRYVDALTARFADEPWVERVEGLTTVKVVRPPRDEFDPIEIGALGLEVTEERIAGDPIIDGTFVDAARTATAVFVTVDSKYRRIAELQPLMRRLDEIVDGLEPPPGARVIRYGLPYLRAEVVEMLERDQLVLFPLTAAVFMVVLLLLFGGRPIAVAAPFAAIGVTVIWTSGLMGYAGEPVNLLTNVLPVMLFAIGISDSIHLLARYAEECGAGGDGRGALVRATTMLAGACFLTSFTTAVGFASLLVSRTTILVSFGWLSAVGVVFAYVTTILLVPALLSFGRPLQPRGGMSRESAVGRLAVRLGAAIVARPVRWLAGGLAIGVVMAAGALHTRVDTRVYEAFDPDSELYARQMVAERALGGLLPLEVSVRAAERDRLRDPDILRRVWALQRFMESRPGVGVTLSPASFVRTLWVAVEGEKPAPADPLDDPNLPRTREALAQLLLLGSMAGDDLPWDRVVTDDWRHLRIAARLEDRGSQYYMPVFEEIEARAAALFDGVDGVEVRLTGQGLTATTALVYFIEDLLYSLLLASVIIFGAMTLLFRSVRTGLISVVPNLFPLLCTFGYMGLAGIPLNATTIITFSVSLGIAVDDTIHFLTRFDEEHARHPVEEAVRRTMRHAGRPILMTTVLLCLGFGVLMTSDFLATARFAWLVVITMIAALPGDLIILPALLRLFARRRAHEHAESVRPALTP